MQIWIFTFDRRWLKPWDNREDILGHDVEEGVLAVEE